MVYKEIIRMYDERRRKLEGLIGEDTVQLSHERTHQIKGAIDEIDLFLMTLRQHQDQRIHRNFSYKAELQDERRGMFKKLFSKDQRATSRHFAMNEARR